MGSVRLVGATSSSSSTLEAGVEEGIHAIPSGKEISDKGALKVSINFHTDAMTARLNSLNMLIDFRGTSKDCLPLTRGFYPYISVSLFNALSAFHISFTVHSFF